MAQLDKISKEELVHTTLVGMARKLGPNGQLPTVKQLCTRLSVSRSTLDRVLRSLEKERLLICRHGSGIFVSPHSNQRRIGLIFGGNIHDPIRYSQFWWLLHQAVMSESDRHNNELRTYYSCPTLGNDSTDPSNFALIDDLESRRLSGLLIAGMENTEQIRWLRQWRIPIVSLGNQSTCDANVVPDQNASLKEGFRALSADGCKRIALIATGVSSQDFVEESDVYSTAFKRLAGELGLDYSPNLRWFENTIPAETPWETHEDAGIKIIRHHFPSKKKAPPDGLFFTDDTSAHGGLIALLNLGIIPGKHVRIAVQTNKGASLLRPFYPQIFRVEIDPNKIAEEMFHSVHTLLNSGQSDRKRIFVKPSLIPPGELAEKA